jgi:hypothetical protein
MNDWLEVHALLDEELSPEERTRVQDKVKTCKTSEAEWRAVRELKTIISEKCAHPADCDEVWLACTKRIKQLDRTKTAESFVGKYAWGLCGSFCVMILLAAGYSRMNGGNLRPSDLQSVDAGLIPIPSPRSQATSDLRTWLQDNLSQTMHPAQDQVTVERGAFGHLPDGRRVTEASLHDSTGALTLFVVEQANKVDDVEHVDTRYSGGTIGSKNCITWTDGGNAYLLAGERSLNELCQRADSISNH